MLFIGDVHERWDWYIDLISKHPASIQVGDLELGYPSEGPDMLSPLYRAAAAGNHRFIRGNHDCPETCAQTPFWIPDGTIENSTMYVGGAWTPPHDLLIEGYNWNPDTEEVSQAELDRIVDDYAKAKPSVMVTHDCPASAVEPLFRFGDENPRVTRTREAFDRMLEVHRPDLWIFGHVHVPAHDVLGGTEFICINKFEYIEL